jgi:hypothetical protein
METPPSLEGGCQCGAIRYRCGGRPFVAYTCHCVACQKLTGSAFCSCMHVPAETVDLLRGAPAVFERVADSGNRLAISFCAACSTPLFTANAARPRMRTIYLGSLDTPRAVQVSAHIWTTRRLPWVVLPDGARVFPEGGDWRPDYASDPTRLTG